MGVVSAQDAPKMADLPDSAVVAERGGVNVTVGELRAKVRLALGEERSRGYFADGQRVAQLIDDQLSTKQLVAEAKANGLDKDPQMQAEMASYIRGVLARRQVEYHLDNMKFPDVELLAQERYQANKSSFIEPGSRDVRHILILTRDKSDEAAKAKADEAHAALVKGEDFDEVLHTYSEDPEVAQNGWVRGVRDDGSFDAEFTKAAMALQKPGDISAPVKSAFGYHVIRLQSITPEHQRTFDEVKDKLIAKLRKEQRDAAREAYLNTFKALPTQLNDETMKQLPNAES
ncbi:MAG TPA: peptidylprolyl isomerase [Chiayiivirga sp.]|nr:peptidylprolyl isomerase [Chiayiivirga sp.]